MSKELFGGGSRVNDTPQPASSLRIQTSVQGKAIPIVYGRTRVPGNVIWYGDFTAYAQQQGGGGGKGGVFGGGGQATTTYTYTVAVAFGICEGPILSVYRDWRNKSYENPSVSNLVEFLGDYAQSPWGYLSSRHPSEAYNYRGLAYAAAGPLSLGDQPELPNYNFEIISAVSGAVVASTSPFNPVRDILDTIYPNNNGFIGGLPISSYVNEPLNMLTNLFDLVGFGAVDVVVSGTEDANPADVVEDFLTNQYYGLPSWPAGMLASLSTYSDYCLAAGLLVSYALVDQREASAFLVELVEATNSEFVWADGVLDIVPRGDTALSANGATYTPPIQDYDLTDDDFLPNPDTDDDSPIAWNRRPQSDKHNDVAVEFLDRQNAYNPSIIEAKDDASIELYGLNKADTKTWHVFNLGSAAQQAATLLLGREQVAATCTFVLPPQFVLLNPMDIVSLTDSVLGLNAQWVRILEIKEDDDGVLHFTAEEYLAGTGGAPLYGSQAGTGNIPDYNADPGNIADPVLFEPTDQLAGGLEIWAAMCGTDPDLYGGCDVWVSTDGETYAFVDRVLGPSRFGTLTAQLATIAQAPVPPTIDQTHTLHVDLATSEGTLSSGSQQDALALSTACWVDGEVIAYRDATLVTGFQYDLSYLVRGVYGTESEIGAHAASSTFVRLDNGIARIPFNQDQIGQTIYIKFLAFNVWHGGAQTLSDVSPYAYVIQGTALSSPLPDIDNLRTGFVGMISQILWDEITDFRPVRYQVSKGPTFLGSQILRTVAHPPFATQGDGLYWVTAVSEPVPGLVVYSETPQSIDVEGSVLTDNVVATRDMHALGWPGTFTGGAFSDGTKIRTGSTGDFLAIADFLGQSDFLNSDAGNSQQDGTYHISAENVIQITDVRACKVTIDWIGTGETTNGDFLGHPDFLDQVDFLDYQAAARVDVFPEIRTAQTVGAGFLARTDFLGTTDFLHEDDFTWGDWQKYETAYYTGRAFDARMMLNTFDPGVIAEALSMTITVDVPDRVDTYNGLTIPDTGYALVFTPVRATSPAAFNGGPGGDLVPIWQGSISSPTAGDQIVVSDLTLEGATITVQNGGAPVTRSGVNLLFQGY